MAEDQFNLGNMTTPILGMKSKFDFKKKIDIDQKSQNNKIKQSQKLTVTNDNQNKLICDFADPSLKKHFNNSNDIKKLNKSIEHQIKIETSKE